MASAFVDDPRDRAFERLYERYDREVYRYALSLLRNPSEAEDVTQTTFLNAYRAIQAGEEPQKPHNWLIAIAHNACRSRVRFAMRRPKEVPLDDVVEQLAVPDQERTNVRELLRALGRLPFNQRAAITMRELEGRSYPEIADTLGVTVPAVEALISRARKALRLQAAALRGVVVVQLPRSLRRLFEHADAAGGVGSKAVAVLVAGAVAGGVGYTVKGSAHHAKEPAVPRVELVTRGVAPAPTRHRVVARTPKTRERAHTARVKHTSASSVPPAPPSLRARPDAGPTGTVAAPAPVDRPAPPAPAAPAAPHAPAAAPPAPAQAAKAPPAAPGSAQTAVDTVTTAAQAAVDTVTTAVKQAAAALPVPAPPPLPPVQVPPVQVPPVQVPPVQVPPTPVTPPINLP